MLGFLANKLLRGMITAIKLHRIFIENGPPPRSYKSLDEAVTNAERHPLQGRARSASALIEQSQVAAANWSTGACEIHFTNDSTLYIAAQNFQLDWQVYATKSLNSVQPYEPVSLVWSRDSESVFDPCTLTAQLCGADFVKLFVNELGLLLYTRRNPILWFSAVRIRESSHDFLYAWLDD